MSEGKGRFRPILTLVFGLVGGLIGARLSTHLPGGQPPPPAPAPMAPPVVQLPTKADGIADLVAKVAPAVVNIDTEAHRRVAVPQDPFSMFFGGNPQPQIREEVARGVGSGFVVRASGLIVTNFHVIRGADKLQVTFSDGTKLEGKVVGKDPASDLALVKVVPKAPLSVLNLADPKSLRVGQYVVAVGSPLGLSQSVTSGILSAINRTIGLNARVSFLQTDAPINPGNSGGPLLNLAGEVVGVNTAVAARGQGIGFAIPVELLANALPQLEGSGTVAHPWIGVDLAPLPADRSTMFYPVEHGVLVAKVEANSPAAKAGLLAGDAIVSIAGVVVDEPSALVREVAKAKVGDQVTLLVSRQGQQKQVMLKLEAMPRELSESNRVLPQEGGGGED